MKTNSKFCFIFFAALSMSCAPKILFSFSQDLPVVNIGVHIKNQQTQHYLMTISANHLLSDEKLHKLLNINMTWSASEIAELRNAELPGKKIAYKSTFKFSFPYNPVEICMTAANDESLCKPDDIHIFKK